MASLTRRKKLLLGAIALSAAALSLAYSKVANTGPDWATDAILYPHRWTPEHQPPPSVKAVEFTGKGVTLAGWHFRTSDKPRGTVIYLHGVGDNRGSAIGIARRLTPQGFDVVAYDSRAHGESGGKHCTYGFYEKQDLRQVLNEIAHGPIVLLGSSMGAAVALQTAAIDNRIAAVIAAETFADFESAARARAPIFFTEPIIQEAFARTEREGNFRIAAVSPVKAAARITAPVLLVHGKSDRITPPEHSQKVFEALPGPKKLILVPDARHNQSLGGASTWSAIEAWLDQTLARLEAENKPLT